MADRAGRRRVLQLRGRPAAGAAAAARAARAAGCASGCSCRRRPAFSQLAIDRLRVLPQRRRRRRVAAARAAARRAASARWSAAGGAASDAGRSGAAPTASRPVGFGDDEALLPESLRGFAGYRLLQEYFAVPAALPVLRGRRPRPQRSRASRGNEVELIVLLFSAATPALESAVDAGNLALYCMPAINLFQKRARPHPARRRRMRVPRGSRPHAADRLRGVRHRRRSAASAPAARQQDFLPLYATPTTSPRGRDARGYYTRAARAAPAVADAEARRRRARRYIGSEVFLSLVDPREAPYREDLRQLVGAALHQPRPADALPHGPTAAADAGGSSRRAPVQRVDASARARRGRMTRAARGRRRLAADQPAVAELPVAARRRRRAGARRRCASMLRLYAPRRRRGLAAADRRRAHGARSTPVVRRQPVARADRLRPRPRDRLDRRRAGVRGRQRVPARRGVLEHFFARHVSINSFTQTRAALADARRGDALAAAPRRAGGAVSARRPRPSADDRRERRHAGRDALAARSSGWRRRRAASTSSRRCAASRRASATSRASARRCGRRDEPLRLARSRSSTSRRRRWPRSSRPAPARRALGVRVFGLLGPQRPAAAAPDRVRARAAALPRRPDAARASSTCFHHRLSRCSTAPGRRRSRRCSLDRPGDDRFAAWSARWSASATPAPRDRDALPATARSCSSPAGWRAQPRNADGLASCCAGYFDVPVRVEQFVGHWLPLAADERTRLGARSRPSARPRALGAAPSLGRTVWDVQHKFRIAIGPLAWRAIATSCPAARGLAAAARWVRQYVGFELALGPAADACARDEVPAPRARRARAAGSAGPPGCGARRARAPTTPTT